MSARSIKLVERGIAKLLPPRGLERLLVDAGALRRDERRRRGFRRAIVGADGARAEQRRDAGINSAFS